MKLRESWIFLTTLLAVSIMFAFSAPAAFAGNTPINDLGSGLYLGQYSGGLYPGGSNDAPPEHTTAGLARAGQIQPLDTLGDPDPNGRYVFLSIGMSNTTQEFSTFVSEAAGDSRVNHDSLAIVDGARGGQAAGAWTSPLHPNYDIVRDQRLAPQGLTEQQVQAAWVKVANPSPSQSLPAGGADAFTLVSQMGDITRALAVRYPNLKSVFFSSRIYAGYATSPLNPEPYAYESGFSVKWLIEAQIDQMAAGGADPLAGDLNYDTGAPWTAWGPYLWADGLNPRSDGLIWERSDLANDGTHPSLTGRQKVSGLMMDFMLNSPFTRPWFATTPINGDVDKSGFVDDDDLSLLLTNWGQVTDWEHGELSGTTPVNDDDLSILLSNWHAGTPPPAPTAIPEPASAALLLLGLVGLLRQRKIR